MHPEGIWAELIWAICYFLYLDLDPVRLDPMPDISKHGHATLQWWHRVLLSISPLESDNLVLFLKPKQPSMTFPWTSVFVVCPNYCLEDHSNGQCVNAEFDDSQGNWCLQENHLLSLTALVLLALGSSVLKQKYPEKFHLVYWNTKYMGILAKL